MNYWYFRELCIVEILRFLVIANQQFLVIFNNYFPISDE